MCQLHCCSNARDTRIDRRGDTISDLGDARDHAISVIRSLLMTRSSEDWRGWVLCVRDDIFAMPFAFVAGKPR